MRGALQNKDPGALTQDEAVAVRSEGAGGGLRVGVARGQGPHGAEGGHGHRVEGRIRPPGHDDVGPSQRDEVRTIGDGLGPGGAGRDRSMDAAVGPQLDTDSGRRGVGHERWDRRRQNPPGPLVPQRVPGLHDRQDRPHTRGDGYRQTL